MSDKQFKDLYEETELLGNLLYYREEEIYKEKIEQEPDPKRQKEMRTRAASGFELGLQMGIVWQMHDLYKAKTIQDIEAVKTYFQNI